MKKLSTALALVALVSGVSSAQATTTNWGAHDLVETGTAFVAPNTSFTDFYTFNLSTFSSLVSVTVAANAANILNIANGSVSLFSGSNTGSGSLIGSSYSFDGTSGSTVHSFSNLSFGNYYYAVSGTANGSSGGVYVINSAAAVPEPESIALLLAGLGVAGWAKRRANGKSDKASLDSAVA